MTSQVVSKQRVAEHGEVFTSPREVNAMLDLVKQETERIESRFLEPACGTGNFLTEILTRKLKVVERKYRKSQLEFERKKPKPKTKRAASCASSCASFCKKKHPLGRRPEPDDGWPPTTPDYFFGVVVSVQ